MNAYTKKFLAKGLPYAMNHTSEHAAVGKWLLGTAGMVVGMIHVGGVTRLTQSGLSMTTWSPLGTLPPLSQAEWMTEFERYKQYPEWQQRQSMSLQEFQYIYAWEYGHRMLGRTVGLVFAVPWMYFTLKTKIPTGFQPKLLALLAMGGTQGLVGWWMVKSGLGDDRRGDAKEIRVKPIRLASHLSMAVATYGALLWTGLDVLGLHHSLETVSTNLSKTALQQASRIRAGGIAVSGLTFCTIISGALVAGNDAGRAYNTFPTMDGQWIPKDKMWELHPPYTNLYENTAMVQFNHRILGTWTALGALGLTFAGLKRGHVTPQARKGLTALGLAATGQVTLGITALLTYVPISLAAAHQLGSIVVFSCGLYVVHSLRYARPVLRRAARHAAVQSA